MKRWIGFALALLVAGWLATLELNEPPPEEWAEVPLLIDDAPPSPVSPSESPDLAPVGIDVSAASEAGVARGASWDGTTRPAPVLPELNFDLPPAAQIAGRIEADSSDHFVATPAARLLFESYYATFAPQSDDLIRGRLVLHVLDTLPPRAADEAIEVLDLWRAERQAVAAFEGDPSPQQLRALREEIMGADLANALYGGGG